MEYSKLYIISGCNGAGKTTASFSILPEMLKCKEFVNADEIAKGISPFNYESVSIQAGRLMLARIEELLTQKKTFAFETTLASRTFTGTIKKAKILGYSVTLLYFWLSNVEIAKDRVRTRVLEGGHNIVEDVIERRYTNGIKNLFNLYTPLVDNTIVYDNTNNKLAPIFSVNNNELNIINKSLYSLITRLIYE